MAGILRTSRKRERRSATWTTERGDPILTETPVLGPDIIEIQPCTEEGLVTLEAKLGGKEEREFLDPAILCRCLNASPIFEHPRCSAEMGYGMLEKDGRKIHAFKTGKVIIRRAEGREQALSHLRLVSRTIWPAMKVLEGESLLVCLASEKGCETFPAPPADGGGFRTGRSFPEAIAEARSLPRWDRIEEGLAQLRAIAAAYPLSGVSKATKEQFRKADGSFLRFIVETEDARNAATGIPFLAASYFLDIAMQACEKLPADQREAVWALAVEAFELAVAGSSKKANEHKQRLKAEYARTGADRGPMLSLVRLATARLP
jgi:hypothetical protein